jgi:hypothetical protein
VSNEKRIQNEYGCLACTYGIAAGFRFWCSLRQCGETHQSEAVATAQRCNFWQWDGEEEWANATSTTRETAQSAG